MNRHELILEFIKRNLDLILSPDFLKTEFRNIRRKYFIESNRGHGQGVPPNKEIASEAVRYLVKIGKITNENELVTILNLPFFKKYVRNPTPFFDFLKMNRRSTPVLDMTDIGKREFIDQIREQTRDEMKQGQIAQIDEEIDKKKAELAALPSIIELTDPLEPSIIEYDDESRSYTPWWVKLNLVVDPFPTTEGIQDFEKDVYDQIVYKTELFKRYMYYMTKTREELFKNTLFFGQFGSGKTTLFQYLNRELWSANIAVLYLAVFTESNIHTMTIRFRQELIRRLKGVLKGSIDTRIAAASYENLDDQIIELLKSHLKIRQTEGFIIFVDDLHKNIPDMDISFQFLAYLQTFTAKLNRELGGKRLAFYIAGLPEWREPITTQPRYSGSIQRKEDMPQIGISDAHRMLNLRLESFYPNPELKREIKIDFVEQIYAYMKEHDIPITFREFINRAVDEFQKGNFEILTADPFHISTKTISEIKREYEEHVVLGRRFNNLLVEMNHLENRRKVLKILVRLFQRKAVRDDDPLIQDNVFFLKKLSKASLIQKARTRQGVLAWVLCSEIIKTNEAIMKKYSLSIEDYLLLIYSEPTQMPVGTNEEIELIEKLMEMCEEDVPLDYLENTKNLHKQIIEAQSGKKRVGVKQLRDMCINSLASLSRFYFELVDCVTLETQPIQRWKTYWKYPPEIDQFLRSIWGIELLEDRIWYIVSNYRQSFEVISQFVLNQMERSSHFPIDSTQLVKRESEIIDEAIRHWINQRYIEAAHKIRLLITDRLGIFLYNVFHLLFGIHDERMKHIPPILRQKLSKIVDKQLLNQIAVSDVNEFSEITLDEIKKVMTGEGGTISSENWRTIFADLFWPKRESQFIRNIDALSNLCKIKGWSGDNIEELRILIWKFTDILKKCNSAYIELLKNNLVVDMKGNTAQVYISPESEKRGGVVPIEVTSNFATKMLEMIPEKMISLADSQFIHVSFGCSYRSFMAFLGLSIRGDLLKLFNLRKKVTLKRINPPLAVLKIISSDRSQSIYIAHSNEDEDYLILLEDVLNSEGFFVRKSSDVQSSKSLKSEAIEDSISKSDGALILVSKSLADSELGRLQIEQAIKRNQVGESFFILVVRTEDCAVPIDIARFHIFKIIENTIEDIDELVKLVSQMAKLESERIFDTAWNIDHEKVAKYVSDQREEPLVEIKAEIHIDTRETKAEFIRDIIAMANRSLVERKNGLILAGPRGDNEYGQTEFPDDNVYQSIVNNKVNPSINFLFKTILHNEVLYGVFIIQPTGNRPIVVGKKYDNSEGKTLLKEGQCWIREGTTKKLLRTNGIIDLAKQIGEELE